MGKLLSSVGMAGGIFMSACNACNAQVKSGARRGEGDAGFSEVLALETESEAGKTFLKKHDWNGLSVMMTEGQARAALGNIGFGVVPSRTRTFLTYDPARPLIHLRTGSENTTSMVFMETRRNRRVLMNVWGVHLVFLKNRLFQFSPQYFTTPAELVEPGDEYIAAGEMERKLKKTFGDPNVFEGKIGVRQGGSEAIVEKTCIWADERLMVVFRRTSDAGIERHSLVFSLPGEKGLEKYPGY